MLRTFSRCKTVLPVVFDERRNLVYYSRHLFSRVGVAFSRYKRQDTRQGFLHLLVVHLGLPERRVVSSLSCPLQALNGEGQQEADDLQLETSWCHRMDLPGK